MSELDRVVASLERTGQTLLALSNDVSPDDARIRPAPTSWAIVEVFSHLLDEERRDFRARIASLFEDPERSWEPIDPEAWVRDGDSISRSISVVAAEFADERVASLRLLGEWADLDWSTGRDHPKLGRLTAGDLVQSWATHDLIHIRQLLRLHHFLIHRGGSWASDYAGRW